MRKTLSVLVAIAVLATSCNSPTSAKCATVGGAFDAAYPDLWVSYHVGVNTLATTDSLAARYGFTPIRVDTASGTFTMPAPQPASVLNGVRCEPSVWLIGYDGPIVLN